MKPNVLRLQAIGMDQQALVGGKAWNLGLLAKMDGILVPDGFCVTTEAYRKATERHPVLQALITQLNELVSDDQKVIQQIGSQIREVIAGLSMDEGLAREVTEAVRQLGSEEAYAVRSSATAEDLPTASFAGQQDTYLNIRGVQEILRCVTRCWASLFTDRAIVYRQQNGFDHREVLLAVIVQRMVVPEASGIMFTVDPVTSDRLTLSIDAGFGLGEALVSGLVDADTYRVRNGGIASRRIGKQLVEIRPSVDGGTEQLPVEASRQRQPALSDEQILRLAGIGKLVERQFGCPQDIEWCVVGNQLYLLQSRPITTLFPAPVNPDGVKRIYLSFGHMQVMTDSILPLGMSVLDLAAMFPMERAGGRLFVDITQDLATASGRRIVMQKVDGFDPIMAGAVRELLTRQDYLQGLPRGKGTLSQGANWLPWLTQAYRIYRTNDPALLDQLNKRREDELHAIESELQSLSGDAVFDFILNDRPNLKAVVFDPVCFGAVLACQLISGWLNKQLARWLGLKDATNQLSKSVEHNVTSEMGIALYQVAAMVRRHPAIAELFERSGDDVFAKLERLQAGKEVAAAIRLFLDRYGMRCPGEIDITRPRWYEQPEQLLPLIMGDVRSLQAGQQADRFALGAREAQAAEDEIVQKLLRLPGGRQKARKVRRMISIYRNFVGAREYPKYYWMCRLAVYKRALMREANRLLTTGAIKAKEDVFYLHLNEFREAVRTGRVDQEVIEQRKQEYAHYAKLTPPRIMLSDGEVLTGEYAAKNAPAGSLVGVPVSAGVVEGRARVVHKLTEALVEPGDILVTAFTDPSWTPLFVSIAGLVTEVGGTMSHGAVITREYGLPAVVGVENATRLIKDGQRIRLNGQEGFVELL